MHAALLSAWVILVPLAPLSAIFYMYTPLVRGHCSCVHTSVCVLCTCTVTVVHSYFMCALSRNNFLDSPSSHRFSTFRDVLSRSWNSFTTNWAFYFVHPPTVSLLWVDSTTVYCNWSSTAVFSSSSAFGW